MNDSTDFSPLPQALLPDHIYLGDALTVARSLPDQCVQCIVTSPPYFGLRDYGTDGQMGLEPTVKEYVANMVTLFTELRRVLRDDGTLWLNLGDSYAANRSYQVVDNKHTDVGNTKASKVPDGLKPKDLIGIPWRVAFALQEDGWTLRSDIIWSKPNPMPESVRDRPTKSHEYVFLFSKSTRYHYDADAIKEPAVGGTGGDFSAKYAAAQPSHGTKQDQTGNRQYTGFNGRWKNRENIPETRNKRSVWTVSTKPFKGSHFATFPTDLIEPMIKAGCPAGGIVYDPFMGAGTVGVVAQRLGRHYAGSELNPEYLKMAEERIATDAPKPARKPKPSKPVANDQLSLWSEE